MKKNGFTLVELLAVILVIAILSAIGITSAVKISKNMKNKSYITKIDLIEKAVLLYADDKQSQVYNGTLYCKYENGEISYTMNSSSSYYDCGAISINDLIEQNYFTADKTVSINGVKMEVVEDPTTDSYLNNCYVFAIKKNGLNYVYFDRDMCDNKLKSKEPTLNYSELTTDTNKSTYTGTMYCKSGSYQDGSTCKVTKYYDYDCSYDESYDCSYDRNYDCSYNENYDCSYNTPYSDCSSTSWITSNNMTDEDCSGFCRGKSGCSCSCGSGRTPTCTGTVCTTKYKKVSKTCTRTVSKTCTERVSQSCSRRVSRTCTGSYAEEASSYKAYKCTTGDDLSGTTCTHHTCETGWTLDNTTKQCILNK